eukprot:gene12616-28062_t
MKFQSKQKQVKKLAGQAAHKPGEVAAAKAAQCAIQCPVCRSMLSDAVVAKAHFESKHESKKVPLPDGWAEAAAAGRNKGKKGKKDGKK